MEFRDALGVSRKFAVPLVDYLDKIRFTVRSGNNRTPGVEAKKLVHNSTDGTPNLKDASDDFWPVVKFAYRDRATN